MKYFILLLLAVFILACNNSEPLKVEKIECDTIVKKKENKVVGIITDSTERITVIFPEFKLELFGAKIFEKQQSSDFPLKTENDTLNVWLEFNNSIEDKYFRISSNNSYTVFQKYRTSMIIKNINTYLGFYDWKHYNSDWIQLSSVKGEIFKSRKYSTEEIKQFPTVSKDQILKTIKILGDNEWYNLAKDIKTVYDSPCDVIIDRVYLKIESEGKTRVIVFINQLKL